MGRGKQSLRFAAGFFSIRVEQIYGRQALYLDFRLTYLWYLPIHAT